MRKILVAIAFVLLLAGVIFSPRSEGHVILDKLITDRFESRDVDQFDWTDQTYGPNAVGFTTIKTVSKTGNPTLISVWYPAKSQGKFIALKDYIVADSANGPQSQALPDFKRLAERIYDRSFPTGQFESLSEKPVHASLGADMKSGTFPLVIAPSEPAYYYYLFEYLASHGYVVAAVNTFYSERGPDPSSGDHYTRYTDALQELMEFMKKQPYVNSSDITAFGHGGGIQSAAYLAMRTPDIKRVVNLDGGFFGPRSKTTVSNDYKPEKMKVPFLHIVTVSQQQEDDQAQVNALKKRLTKVFITSPALRHHDFTAWGILMAPNRPDEAKVVNETVNAVNEVILKFLKGEKLSGSTQLYKIDKS